MKKSKKVSLYGYIIREYSRSLREWEKFLGPIELLQKLADTSAATGKLVNRKYAILFVALLLLFNSDSSIDLSAPYLSKLSVSIEIAFLGVCFLFASTIIQLIYGLILTRLMTETARRYFPKSHPAAVTGVFDGTSLINGFLYLPFTFLKPSRAYGFRQGAVVFVAIAGSMIIWILPPVLLVNIGMKIVTADATTLMTCVIVYSGLTVIFLSVAFCVHVYFPAKFHANKMFIRWKFLNSLFPIPAGQKNEKIERWLQDHERNR